jgi:2-polyprenyl-3-methyl-5-hydroxy-6-metoxy-1,4-benzoquinol methylase
MKQLNLGCGEDIREGWDNQDYTNFKGVNLVFDLESKDWPIEDNTYDFILCNHIIEHVQDIWGMFNNLHRVCKPGGIIKIEVPHYSLNAAFTQIDHKHYFGLDSLSILEEKDFQNKTLPFKVLSQRILWRGEKSSKIMQAVSWSINKITNCSHGMQLFIDRFFSKLTPYYFMEYTIEVIKEQSTIGTETQYIGTHNFPTSIVDKCKKVLKERGFFRTLSYFFELCYYTIKPRTTFMFAGKKYKSFYHWYNTTWRGEREIELAIFLDLIKDYKGNLLEVGNVLPHYGKVPGDILDKYETGEGIINEDVVTYNPNKKYDLIVSVSTLEHVGWDETPKDPAKFLLAIENLKRILSDDGKLMFTIPLGFNSYLDDLILNNKIDFHEKYFFKRINGKWIEKELNQLPPVNLHDDLCIGVIKK